ncbi:MAG: ABC transporter permease [Magnetococcus sp. WYHC-3]
MIRLPSPSPLTRQRWELFRSHRRGYVSLWIFGLLFLLSLGAEVFSNDKPLVVYYQGSFYWPVWHSYPETAFGGDFDTETDYRDPFMRQRLEEGGWVVFPPNPHSFASINLQLQQPAPSPPTSDNLLGTDDRGRDVLARLIYGFRLSVLFALGLTIIGVVLGVLAGAVQGYFGGRVDLLAQRFMEIWGSMPELYLLVILLSLFGWMGLSDYVRAEFLRGRALEYVTAARALGVSNVAIMYRHLLPNALTPVITFLPFRISGAILALESCYVRARATSRRGGCRCRPLLFSC